LDFIFIFRKYFSWLDRKKMKEWGGEGEGSNCSSMTTLTQPIACQHWTGGWEVTESTKKVAVLNTATQTDLAIAQKEEDEDDHDFSEEPSEEEHGHSPVVEQWVEQMDP
jgi:hypothetical protein